jgi:hypothetical protein
MRPEKTMRNTNSVSAADFGEWAALLRFFAAALKCAV